MNMFENMKTNLFDFLYLYKLWLHFHMSSYENVYLFILYIYIFDVLHVHDGT